MRFWTLAFNVPVGAAPPHAGDALSFPVFDSDGAGWLEFGLVTHVELLTDGRKRVSIRLHDDLTDGGADLDYEQIGNIYTPHAPTLSAATWHPAPEPGL